MSTNRRTTASRCCQRRTEPCRVARATERPPTGRCRYPCCALLPEGSDGPVPEKPTPVAGSRSRSTYTASRFRNRRFRDVPVVCVRYIPRAASLWTDRVWTLSEEAKISRTHSQCAGRNEQVQGQEIWRCAPAVVV